MSSTVSKTPPPPPPAPAVNLSDAGSITKNGKASDNAYLQQYAKQTQDAYDAVVASPKDAGTALTYAQNLGQLAVSELGGAYTADQATQIKGALQSALKGAGVEQPLVDSTLKSFFD